MSQIVPSPNARQIRQALEQGLRGIAKSLSMSASVLVTSFPLLSKFATFTSSKALALVGILANKTPSMSRTFVVQTTQDVSKSASWTTSGSVSVVPDTGSFDLTLEVDLGGGSTPGFDALAEVFQI